MKLENSTVCVTGAAGFIGSALCAELINKGCHVIALDNFSYGHDSNIEEIKDKLEIVKADVRDIDSLKKHIKKSQIIFHLAAIDDRKTCQKNFSVAFDINTKGTANILSLCSKVDRVIFLSSNMVYGESKYLPIDEKHPLDGFEPYAVTKIACEYLFRAYNFLNNIPFTVIRNFNTFGPKQSQRSMIPTLIIEALTKKEIEVWTPGVVRDFQYVDNCIDALIKVVESESTRGETINLGSGKGITTGEITAIICKYLNTTWVNLKKPTPVSNKLICDIRKIKALTDWKPKIALEEGLKKTIEYYKSVIKDV